MIIHLACKDWNRNALESRGWKLGSAGFDNVLALSGDYPGDRARRARRPGVRHRLGRAARLFSAMNEGLPDARRPGGAARAHGLLPRLRGHQSQAARARGDAAVLQAAQEGAGRARGSSINQIGWNARKDDELLRWIARRRACRSRCSRTSTSSRRTAARVFHSGRIPGVVVARRARASSSSVTAASADKGRGFFVDLAAKHVAVARGLGFDGVYLGGHMPRPRLRRDPRQAASFAAADWRELAREIQLPASGRVLFLRAGSGDGALLRRGERRVSRVEAPPPDRSARSGGVPLQPADACGRLRARGAALPRRPRRLRRRRQGPPASRSGAAPASSRQ